MILETLSSLKIFLLRWTQVASRPCGLRDLQFSSMQEKPSVFLESCLTFKVLHLSNRGINSDWTLNVLEIWHPMAVSSRTIFQPHTRWRNRLLQRVSSPNRTKVGLSLWGLEKGSSWSNMISFLPAQRRTIELPQGKPFRVGQCGVCPVMGMEDY